MNCQKSPSSSVRTLSVTVMLTVFTSENIGIIWFQLFISSGWWVEIWALFLDTWWGIYSHPFFPLLLTKLPSHCCILRIFQYIKNRQVFVNLLLDWLPWTQVSKIYVQLLIPVSIISSAFWLWKHLSSFVYVYTFLSLFKVRFGNLVKTVYLVPLFFFGILELLRYY